MLRRLRRLDRGLLVLGLPLWLLWLVLQIRAFPLAGFPPLLVSAFPDEGEYPKATYFAPFVPVEDSGIRIGDRVRRVGDFDLRGLGSLEYVVRFMEVASRMEEIPIEYERAGLVRVAAVGAIGWKLLWPVVPTGAASLVVGLLVLFRAPRSRVAQASFHAALATAFLFLFAGYASSRAAAWVSLAIAHAAFLLVMPLFVRLLLLFPHGAPPQTWLGRLGPWAGLAFGLTQTATIFGFPYSGRFNTPIGAGARALGFGAVLGCLAQLYHRSDPLERRKLRIIVLGVYCAVLPAVLGYLWASLRPQDLQLANLSTAAFVVVPFFAYLALYRYDVFDVDRVLGSAVSYNLILFVLVGIGFFLVPVVAAAVSSVSGVEPVLGQVVSALALAALVVPGQRVLRPRIEALLFRERRALDEGLENLRSELSANANPKQLLERLGSRLHELLRPESTVLYARDGATLTAVFVAGRGVVPALEADGPVLAVLRGRAAPLSIDATGRGRGSDLGPFERAALEVLNAAVVVPIGASGGGMGTLLCLGPKRSSDIYTPSELRVLAALADRTALELQRFDQLEVVREGQAMQEALRRYVPGAVAEKVARGEELAPEEREVTVLFVDLRGYTSLAEGRRADEIFSTVNVYTERVSHLVRGAGGSVVEFNGDGMMAVFGAPEPLPEKERAAVRAARGIVAEVGTLELDGLRLSVGIGIATGEAYVGNIQAADRLIWSAIGNTTNLAARLQGLSRELDAAIVIDASTWEALGEEQRAGFVAYEQTFVRGRSRAVDVHALPLGRA